MAYRFGNSLVIDDERVIHQKSSGSIFNGAQFDEVWTNQQHVNTCASYWATCYRAPVRVLPHIWEPIFVNAATREFADGMAFGYQPGRTRKRVAIFEPNQNIVKTCTIPMLVCESAYRQRPTAIGEVFVTNSVHLKEHLTFNRFAGNLDIVKAGLCSFEGRYNTPWFLAKHADIVVAHQWENGLNYAYYDALYGGYPLVHNSDLLPDGVGYRYRGFDAQDGARALLEAIDTHDVTGPDYCRRTADFLSTVRATSRANIEAHARALSELCSAAQDSPTC